jgi:glycosyltransferase 2 family protein
MEIRSVSTLTGDDPVEARGLARLAGSPSATRQAGSGSPTGGAWVVATQEPSRQAWERLARALLPHVLGVATIVAFLLAVSPAAFVQAVSRFDRRWALPVAGLCLLYYVGQGVRWQPLLRAVGVRLPLHDTVLLNVAGQSTGLLPGGELTRAVLVSKVTGVEVGAAVATITVQELIYSVIILGAAVPGAFQHRYAAVGVVVAFLGILAVTVILTVQPVFDAVLRAVRGMPVLRRAANDIQELQRDTVLLLHRRDTLAWSVVAVLQGLVTITMFWMVIHAIAPGALSWQDAAFVYAVGHVAGAAALGPGGLGGFEAATIGMLVGVGLPFGLAVTGSLLQRVADKGLATVFGFLAYLVSRRRFALQATRIVRHDERRRRPRSAQATWR